MVFDVLENAEQYYCLHPRFRQAFEFLKTYGIEGLEEGVYAIDGRNIFAMVKNYQTRMPENGKWEAHKDYIDIQFMSAGEENMGYANRADMQEVEYIADKEQLVLKGEGQFIKMKPNSFFILFRQDAHMPCMAIDQPKLVKKIIVKVRIEV